MPDLYAEIQVNSLAAPLDAFTLSMDQSRGHTGAPNSVVRFRPIKVTITGLAAILAFFTEWAVDSYLRRSGRIVVYEGDRVKWVLSFYDARCTFYYTRFQPGETEQAAYQLTLEIAACAWEMDGLQIEIYSRIPWVKDFKTRWAALTPPAEILPPPSLRNLPAEVRPTPSQNPAPTASLQAQPLLPSTLSTSESPVYQLLPGECLVGSFKQLSRLRKKGDDITPHHIPSDAFMKKHNVSRNDGISIHMEQPETGGRHRKTKTYGGNMTPTQRQAYYDMTPTQALEYDIADARRIYQEQGLLTPHVEYALQEVIRQNKAAFPNLFT